MKRLKNPDFGSFFVLSLTICYTSEAFTCQSLDRMDHSGSLPLPSRLFLHGAGDGGCIVK